MIRIHHASCSLLVTCLFSMACNDDTEDGGGGATVVSSSSTATQAPASGSGTTTSAATSTSTGSTSASGAGELGPTATACALPPAATCEAIAPARCWWIDAANGDDASGDGSEASPWRSLANVVSYYDFQEEGESTPRPATAIDLAPGDVVYLRAGTYDDVYAYQGDHQVAKLRFVEGTAAAPITLAAYGDGPVVVDPGGAGHGITLEQSSHLRIRGIEVANAYGAGVWVGEVNDVVLSHLRVHDTDGLDNDNVAGIYVVGSSDVEVACSTLHDNYDRTSADTGGEGTHNNANMVAFSGGSLRVHHSEMFQTPEVTAAKTGGGVKYKHAASDPDATFEVDHNVFRRCKFFAVGTGTQHTHIHHNLIVGGDGLVSVDWGGPTHQTDQRFENNTIVASAGFAMNPSIDWRDASFDDPQGIVYARNVVVTPLPSPTFESGTVVVGPYASDEIFAATMPELTFDANCYSNPEGPVQFSFFARNGDGYGDEGDVYDLAGWQALGFDVDSVVADPGFVDAAAGDYRLVAGSPCAGKGAFVP